MTKICPPFANSLMREAESIFNFTFPSCLLGPPRPPSLFSSTQNYFAIDNHFILFLDTSEPLDMLFTPLSFPSPLSVKKT